MKRLIFLFLLAPLLLFAQIRGFSDKNNYQTGDYYSAEGFATLAEAIDTLNANYGSTLIIRDSLVLSANDTIMANRTVEFQSGGMIAGDTLVFNVGAHIDTKGISKICDVPSGGWIVFNNSIPSVLPEWYGNSSTDDSNYIQYAVNTGRLVNLYAKLYTIRKAIIFNNSLQGATLEGNSKWNTVITMDTTGMGVDPDTAMFVFENSANFITVENLKLGYSTLPAETDTSVIFRATNSAGLCEFKHIIIGLCWGLTGEPPNRGNTGFFGTNFDQVSLTQWTGWGVFMKAEAGGVSGNEFKNLYLNNIDGDTCLGFVYYHNNNITDVASFSDMNIEWGVTRNSPFYITTAGINIFGCHVEGLDFYQAESYLFEVIGTGSQFSLIGLTVDNTEASASVTTRFDIIKANGASQRINIRNAHIRSTCDFSAIVGDYNFAYIAGLDRDSDASVKISGVFNNSGTAFTTSPIPITYSGSGDEVLLQYNQYRTFALPTMTPVIWATGGSTVLATSGTDKACANGNRFWTEIQIPYNVTLTGAYYLVGSVGGTDSVVVDLYNNAGTLVASSYSGATGAADIVGTAAQIQKVPFTATYNAPAGRYFISLQFNGTTAKFRTYPILGSAFITGTAGGTWRTAASITPGSTFTADVGPICGVY